MPRIGEQIWIGTTYAKAVYAGATKIWPRTLMVSTTSAKNFTAPSWATSCDVWVLGGGGGGGKGGWLSSGSGGGAGQWGNTTWTLEGGEELKCFPGQGGSSESNGTDSTISLGDKVVSGSGGKAASTGSGKDGGTPINMGEDTDDQHYTFRAGNGGTNKSSGGLFPTHKATDGETPGGGGGYGYTSGDAGGRGGDGCCWIIFRNCRKL